MVSIGMNVLHLMLSIFVYLSVKTTFLKFVQWYPSSTLTCIAV